MKFNLKLIMELGKDRDKVLDLACQKGVEEITKFFYNKLEERINQRLYTLDQLKRMGHPYAKKYYHTTPSLETLLEAVGYKGVSLGRISKQSGTLYQALKKETKKEAKKYVGRVYIDTLQVKYAKYVFYGTKYLVARPLHWALVAKYKDEMLKTFYKFVSDYLKKYVQKEKQVIKAG